jgi:multidrug resistance efflux pump
VKAALLCLLLASCGKHAGELQFVDVTRDDLVIGVEVTGELAAVDSLDVRPPALDNVWDFKIANMAAEGDEIKAGEPVIAFDASEQIRNLETMKNEADAAQKKLDKKRDDAALARRDDALKISEAEAGLRKASLKVVPSDLVASTELEQVKLDEQTAKLVLEGAKSHAEAAKRSDAQEIEQLTQKAAYAKHRLDTLKKNVAGMQEMAPRAGTIVYPVNWRGEKHKVGDGVWRMETIMQIVGLGKMVGKGTVDEVDIARVSVAQVVTLRLDALPDSQLKGTVESIAKSVEAKSQTDPSKVASLKVTIEATKLPLRPGMRFRGQVETEKLPKVVQVPTEAVFVTPDGPVAYRKTATGVERVKLALGKRSRTAIEVVSGLAPGDRVSRLDPGAAP